MKVVLKTALTAVCLFLAASAWAQGGADRIVGLYKAVEEGKESKVLFSKQADGTYQGQIIWLKNPNNPDGTPRLDTKNPDAAKRAQRADRVVVVYGVRYDAVKQEWKGGHVYNPTNGKTYNVEVSFKDDKTLRVKGTLAIFSRSVYWTKIE